jgi:hypothetical protein
MVALTDAGTLQIVLEDGRDPARPRWRVTFREVLAYLNLAEEYRLELWGRGMTADRVGWTVRIPESPWLALLGRAEALVKVHHPGAQHYQIGTEDDVIDVLCSAEPEFEPEPAAPPGSPPAGKSTTLYWSEDRPEIERYLSDVVDHAKEVRADERDV